MAIFFGTPGFDLFIANGNKKDLIFGEGGDDFLGGGRKGDDIWGGPGNDDLWGGAGRDFMSGGADNDLMFGNDGGDAMEGDGGNDVMSGGRGKDNMFGGDDDDTMDGNEGSDIIFGGGGNDNIAGGKGRDILNGGDHDDTLCGQGGKDQLDGGIGNDELSGGNKNDVLNGGDGVDTLQGNRGDDTLTGGLNGDNFEFLASESEANEIDWITDFNTGTNVANPADDRIGLCGEPDFRVVKMERANLDDSVDQGTGLIENDDLMITFNTGACVGIITAGDASTSAADDFLGAGVDVVEEGVGNTFSALNPIDRAQAELWSGDFAARVFDEADCAITCEGVDIFVVA